VRSGRFGFFRSANFGEKRGAREPLGALRVIEGGLADGGGTVSEEQAKIRRTSEVGSSGGRAVEGRRSGGGRESDEREGGRGEAVAEARGTSFATGPCLASNLNYYFNYGLPSSVMDRGLGTVEGRRSATVRRAR
jgi:hypothetical protein